jgi:hypothetical protein
MADIHPRVSNIMDWLTGSIGSRDVLVIAQGCIPQLRDLTIFRFHLIDAATHGCARLGS